MIQTLWRFCFRLWIQFFRNSCFSPSLWSTFNEWRILWGGIFYPGRTTPPMMAWGWWSVPCVRMCPPTPRKSDVLICFVTTVYRYKSTQVPRPSEKRKTLHIMYNYDINKILCYLHSLVFSWFQNLNSNILFAKLSIFQCSFSKCRDKRKLTMISFSLPLV